MSDLDKKVEDAIHLTDEELEYIRELEQEEEEILHGKRPVKGMESPSDGAVRSTGRAGAGTQSRSGSTDSARSAGNGEVRRMTDSEAGDREVRRTQGRGGAEGRSDERSDRRPAGGARRNGTDRLAEDHSSLQLPRGSQRSGRSDSGERSGRYPERDGEARRYGEGDRGGRRYSEEQRRPAARRYAGDEPGGRRYAEDSRRPARRPSGYYPAGNRDMDEDDYDDREVEKVTMEDRIDGFFRNHKQLFFFISRALIPIIFFYYEMVFNLTTVRDFWGMQTIYILLFSIFFGMIGSLLSSISKNRKVNMWLKAVFIFLPVIPFLVEFFVFYQFKVFYDLNTIVNGAGGAAKGFADEIFRMIFSVKGMTTIILLFLPVILFLIFELAMDKKHLLSMKTGSKRKIKMAITIAASYILALILILCVKKYRLTYNSEYNFQSSINSFGFMTSVRKEVLRSMTGAGTDVSFDVDPADDSDVAKDTQKATSTKSSAASSENTSGEEVTEAPSTEEQKVYVANRYPISFSELAKNDSGTYAELDTYVSSVNASMTNEYTGLFKGKNLIFLTAEAFSAEVIDKNLTPTLYRLATKGINFTDFYQPAGAGTTGGEFNNITGFYPTKGGASMKQIINYNNYFTMGSQLDRLGYYGKMYHNNDHEFYGRNKTHIKLGYSDGFEAPDINNGYTPIHIKPDGTSEYADENYITRSWPESDLEMIQGTFPQYVNKQPFNIYYMTVSGHNNYGRDYNAMSKKHWDQVQNLGYSDEVKGYIAANLELEDALTWLVQNLEKAGIADDTVIALAADHFPYGLDGDGPLGNIPNLSELYGYNVTTEFQRDHNRLIIWSGCLEKMDPIIVDTPVSSIDILPTLSNLFGTEWDSRLLPGRDVFSTAEPIMFNLSYNWKTDKGTYYGGTFTPKNAAETLPDDYVDRICKIVRNKINYMYGVVENDYFGHLYNLGVFPEIQKEYDYTKAPTVWTKETGGGGTGTGDSGGTGNGGTGDSGGTGTGTGNGGIGTIGE